MTSPSDAAAMVEALSQIYLVRYTRVAAHTIIAVEYFLNLSSEADLIWKSKWSLPKILYLLIRYYSVSAAGFGVYGVLTTSVDHLCVPFVRWESMTVLISSLLSHGVLQIRVYALYGKCKYILRLMLTAFAFCSVALVVIIAFDIRSANESHPIYIPGNNICSTTLPYFSYAFFIPLIIFEGMLCLLVFIRGFITFAAERRTHGIGTTLVNIVIRDSLMMFLALVITYMGTLAVWTINGTTANVLITAAFTVSMSSVFSCRIILNLREAAIEREDATADRIQLSINFRELTNLETIDTRRFSRPSNS